MNWINNYFLSLFCMENFFHGWPACFLEWKKSSLCIPLKDKSSLKPFLDLTTQKFSGCLKDSERKTFFSQTFNWFVGQADWVIHQLLFVTNTVWTDLKCMFKLKSNLKSPWEWREHNIQTMPIRRRWVGVANFFKFGVGCEGREGG